MNRIEDIKNKKFDEDLKLNKIDLTLIKYHVELFIELYPELKDDIKGLITVSGCSSCNQKSKLRSIFLKMQTLHTKRDYTKIIKILPESKPIFNAFLLKEKPKIHRSTCLNCVRKHLAEAYILLKEYSIAYPEHYDIAYGHLAEAEMESIDEYPKLTLEIRTERLKMDEADYKYIPNILNLLKILRKYRIKA